MSGVIEEDIDRYRNAMSALCEIIGTVPYPNGQYREIVTSCRL